jgi:hypothetical protein
MLRPPHIVPADPSPAGPAGVRRRRWRLAAGGVAVVGVAGVVGVVIGRMTVGPASQGVTATPGDPTAIDDAARRSLLAVQAEAESLALAGRLDEARAKYRSLLAAASGRATDARVRAAVGRATGDLAVIDGLIAKRSRQQSAVVSAAVGAAAASRPHPPSAVPPLLRPLVPPSLPGPPSAVASAAAVLPASGPASGPTSGPASSDGGPAVASASTKAVPARPAEVPEPPPRAEPRVVLRLPIATALRSGGDTATAGPADLDDRIDAGIRRGVDFLLTQFRPSAGGLAGPRPAAPRPVPVVQLGRPAAAAAARPAVNRTELLKTIGAMDGKQYGSFVMAVYALASAGRAVDDARLTVTGDLLPALLNALAGLDLQMTYTRGFRAAALAVNARPTDRATLAADAAWLVEMGGVDGKYPYGPSAPVYPLPLGRAGAGGARKPPAPGRPGVAGKAAAVTDFQRTPMGVAPWDNSNSQVALLGVWSAAEAGAVEVPADYWRAAEAHWRTAQLADGQWGYSDYSAGGRPSMTCAGVASLAVTHDYLHAADFVARFSEVAVPPETAAALRWLDAGDNAVRLGGGANGTTGYDLFAFERAGRATGIKYFGGHDWYRELAGRALAAQRPDGSWAASAAADAQVNAVTETAFHLLFLARGRAPVMVNKLRYDGRWSNRPRDVASATRFVSRAAERPLNWQVVNLDRPGVDWLDAPILYVSGNQPIALADADYARFREYVRGGGLVFLHADGGSPAFARWARETFAAKVCPEAPLAPLPPGHGLFRTAAKLPPGTRLEGTGNASRLTVVLSPDDVAGAWQSRDDKTRRPAFDLMLNLFVYATDNVPPRNRSGTPVVADPPVGDPLATFGVARLKHAGDWDPEPGAWPRFANLFRRQTGATADVRAVSASALGGRAAGGAVDDSFPDRPPLAHLTGTAPFALSDAEADGLRQYVEAGGVLLVEACGGSGAFATFAEEQLVPATFPGMALADARPDQVPLAKTQPVTDDLTVRRVRPFALAQPAGRLAGIRVGRWGKGWVLVSRYDLTTGLLGSNVWGVVGFSPDYCVGVVKNVLVWAATMRGDAVAAGQGSDQAPP